MIRVATSAAYLPLMPPLLPKASAHLLRFKSCLRLPDLRDANGFPGDASWRSEASHEPVGFGHLPADFGWEVSSYE